MCVGFLERSDTTLLVESWPGHPACVNCCCVLFLCFIYLDNCSWISWLKSFRVCELRRSREPVFRAQQKRWRSCSLQWLQRETSSGQTCRKMRRWWVTALVFLKVKMTTQTVSSSLTTTEFRVNLFSLLKAFQAHNLCFISSLLLLLVCVFSSSLNRWFTVLCPCFDLHYILLFLGCRDTSSSTISSRRPPRAEPEELGSGETLWAEGLWCEFNFNEAIFLN